MKYDELIKKLRGCVGFRCRDCELKIEDVCNLILMEQAADVIEELQKPKWIPVSERLPEERKFVLVYGEYLHNNIFDGGQMAVSRRIDGNYWSGFGRTERITHWMPLPEFPKDGE